MTRSDCRFVLESFQENCIHSNKHLLKVYHMLNSEFGTGIILDYENMVRVL